MEAVIGGAVAGVVVAVVAPSIISGVGSALRPLAKEVIKGGIYVYDSVATLFSETSEHLSDLVAEAKAELAEKQNGDKVKSKTKDK